MQRRPNDVSRMTCEKSAFSEGKVNGRHAIIYRTANSRRIIPFCKEGTIRIPGALISGKTVISQSLSK